MQISYTTTLDYGVETVWGLLRDFNNYPAYIDGVTDSVIEDDRRGDEVGAVRRFCYAGEWMRQRLVAHSDERRTLTYAGIDPFAYPVGVVAATPPPALYQGTIQVAPVADDRTAIEWSVSPEAGAEHAASWELLLSRLIRDWTDSLARALARGARGSPNDAG